MSSRKKLDKHFKRKLSEEGKKLFRKGLIGMNELELGSNAGSIQSQISPKSDLDDHEDTCGNMSEDEANEKLKEAIELLEEKRETSKVEGITKICAILRSYHKNVILDRKETLMMNLIDCYQKPERASAVIATQAIALVILTLGGDNDLNYAELSSILKQQAVYAKTSSLRVESLYALSIACFVCSSDESCIWEIIGICGNVITFFSGKDNLDVLAALECWGFLISCFDASVVIPKIYDPSSIIYRHVKTMSDLSLFTDTEARSAVCENLGMIVEMKISIAPWKCSMESRDSSLYNLDTKIQELMHQSGRHIGKKNRKSQRSSFKRVSQTIATGHSPEQVLTIGRQVVRITSWAKEMQLKVLKRALQGGLQNHLMSNSLLREVFEVSEYSEDNHDVLTGLEKRTLLSKKSSARKQRTVDLRSSRAQRSKAQQAFMEDY